MGVRDTINRNPALAAIAVSIVIVATGAFIYWQFSGGGENSVPTRAFFSVDDGKTWFADDASKQPPFDKAGQQAVRVRVFECGGKRFVGWMERYSAQVKPQVDAIYAQGKPSPQQLAQMPVLTQMGMEYKKPGDAKWLKQSDIGFAKMMDIKGPNADEPVNPVLP